jgi:hypothetical protein
VLREKGVPFLVVMAYAHETLPAELQKAPYLGKPCIGADVVRCIASLVGRNSGCDLPG